MNTFLMLVLVFASILIGMTIHELGHFIFAKIFKVNVKEFSIGIGPKIFQWKTKKNMKVSWRLIPLMAYVLIDSYKTVEIYAEILNDHDAEKKETYEKILRYRKSNKWYKIKIANFIESKYEKDYKNYEFLASQSNVFSMIEEVSLWKRLLIYFGGVFFNLLAFLVFYLIWLFGFAGATKSNAILPFKQIIDSIWLMLQNMAFIKHDGSGTTIGDIINNSDKFEGQNMNAFIFFFNTFNFLAVFNLMLFFYNLLPIPPLDGYKILIDFLEKIFNFKTSRKVETIVTFIGLSILLYIFVTSIIADFR